MNRRTSGTMQTDDAVKTNDKELAIGTPLSVKPQTSAIAQRAIIRRLTAALIFATGFFIILLGYGIAICYYSRIVRSVLSFICHFCSLNGHYVVESLVEVTIVVVVLTSIYLVFQLGEEERCICPSKRIRSWKVWKLISDFFPVNLVLSEELMEYSQHVTNGKQYVTDEELGKDFCGLPDGKNYLIGMHPHGVCAFSAFFNFATEATGISQAFPNLRIYLAIWPPLSRLPVLRRLMKYLGKSRWMIHSYVGVTRSHVLDSSIIMHHKGKEE